MGDKVECTIRKKEREKQEKSNTVTVHLSPSLVHCTESLGKF